MPISNGPGVMHGEGDKCKFSNFDYNST